MGGSDGHLTGDPTGRRHRRRLGRAARESTDPFEEFEATPTVPVQRTVVEADEADLAEQDAVVPLDDEED